MPHDTPQVTYDTISSVATIEAEPEPVYDIQVQGTECFFADGILVHNCAIIDDPIKDRDSAESETIRQSIKDWYSSTFYTRLAPGGGVLVIMTRWHEDDLSGWLLKCMQEAEQEAAESGEWPEDADRWEVVRYPAIATHDEPYRKAGEALHPARYDLKALMKIKRTLIPRDWEALYQQNPTSADGDYFKKEYFRMYDSAPPLDTLRVYAAWDLAIGKKESNDYTCGIVVGVDRSNDIWVLHRYYGRFDAKELIEKFFECQETWKPTLQGIEHGQIEMTLEPFILKEMTESGRSLNYIKLKTRGNDKMTRARPIQGRMQQMRVHFPSGASWFQELQNEMLAFPSGKHDDQVDAMAWVGQMILMMSPNREKAPPPKKSWRDSLRKQIHSTQGYGLSHMAS
ncbi:phage terminase large subunit [Gallibacterium anatis]